MNQPLFIIGDDFGFQIGEIDHWVVVDGKITIHMISGKILHFEHPNASKNIAKELTRLNNLQINKLMVQS